MKDITKLDFIGAINFDWLDNWKEYKEIRKILLKVFPKEDTWIQNFRYRRGLGGWEVETLYSTLTSYDLERLNEAFEGTLYRITGVGFNYDWAETKNIHTNLCLTINWKI